MAEQPQTTESTIDPTVRALNNIHDALKPISERAPHVDTRQLATIMLHLVETLRGDATQTPIPPRHHA